MSTWKAVYVEQDTPTETEGWYVIGFADSISPVVLKVEGSDTDGLREAIAITVARAMNRSAPDAKGRCPVTYLDIENVNWWCCLDSTHNGRHFAHTDAGAVSWSVHGQSDALRASL